MSRIFITGINGFVGSTLANHLVSKGHIVSGLGRQANLSPIVDPACSYVQGDIRNNIPPIFADVVIHAAALGSDTAAYDDLYKNNVQGTINVIDASAEVSHFIYISSGSVYDFGDKKMKENQAGLNFESLSDYGQTKYIAERKVEEANCFDSKTIFRPHAIYGVNDRLILPRILKLRKGNKVILPRHITNKVTLTNVSNIVQAISLSIEKPKNMSIYNVCDDEVYSLKEVIISLLSEVIGKKLKPIHIPEQIWEAFIRLNSRFHLNDEISKFGSDTLTKPSMLDISLLKSELGFISIKTSAETFKQIGEWMNNNRKSDLFSKNKG